MDATQIERLTTLFKALSDPARLRILGLLAERPHAGHELADRLALTPPTISHHMRRLVAAGLVSVTPDAQSRIYTLRSDALRALSRDLESGERQDSHDQEDDAVIRAFFDGSRLRQIPAARKKRVVVLRRLLAGFAPGTRYSEREVNAILREAHGDVATLRRELVDYGFMVRDRGIYTVAADLPPRGPTVRQEVGEEDHWFTALVTQATTGAVDGETAMPERPISPPR
jgi:DNA-binding transcriptional ArsR family regulator